MTTRKINAVTQSSAPVELSAKEKMQQRIAELRAKNEASRDASVGAPAEIKASLAGLALRENIAVASTAVVYGTTVAKATTGAFFRGLFFGK